MKISTKGRYALRMMVDLAVNDKGEYISLRDVSSRQEISMKYMEQIVSQLTKAGFLFSVRGPHGGYKLARQPESYTIGEILRATEGSLTPVVCLDGQENNCPRKEICSTLEFWQGLNEQIQTYVDSVSLSQLVEKERAHLESAAKEE